AGRRQVPVSVLHLNDCVGDLLAQEFVRRAHVVPGHHNESLIWQSPTSVVQRLIDAYCETADDGRVVQQELLRGILPDTIQVVCKAGSARKHLRITGGDRGGGRVDAWYAGDLQCIQRCCVAVQTEVDRNGWIERAHLRYLYRAASARNTSCASH